MGTREYQGLAGPWTAELLRSLLEVAPEAVIVIEGSGRVALASAEAERLFGYSHQELIGLPVELLVPPRFRAHHRADVTAHSRDPHPRLSAVGLDLFAVRKDGREFSVEVLFSPLRTHQGGPLTYCVVRDISDRKRTENDDSSLAALVHSSDDAIVGQDLDGDIVSWNSGAERLYGYSAEEVLGNPVTTLSPPGRHEDLSRVLARVKSGKRAVNLETTGWHKDGKQLKVSLTVSPVRDKKGEMIGLSTIARDVGVLVRRRDQLRYLAEHDVLTGTRNRRGFVSDLKEQLDRARRYDEHAAVMVIDIDHFKQINDRYGHQAGDRALKAVAIAMVHRLRKMDTVARLGGDEFGVLLPYGRGRQGAVVAADLRRVVAELRFEPVTGQRVQLTVSVGTAILDRDTASDEIVLAAADRDMYRDKLRSQGRQARRQAPRHAGVRRVG